jgi:hypothetical protein
MLQVPGWWICGGRNSRAGQNAPDPSVCCPAGFACTHLNEYHWQCERTAGAWVAPRLAPAVGCAQVGPLPCPACACGLCNACCRLRGCPGARQPLSRHATPCHATPQVQQWQRCGGRSTSAQQDAADAALCCAAGSSCRRLSEWNWVCEPPAGRPLILVRVQAGASAAQAAAPAAQGARLAPKGAAPRCRCAAAAAAGSGRRCSGLAVWLKGAAASPGGGLPALESLQLFPQLRRGAADAQLPCAGGLVEPHGALVAPGAGAAAAARHMHGQAAAALGPCLVYGVLSSLCVLLSTRIC